MATTAYLQQLHDRQKKAEEAQKERLQSNRKLLAEMLATSAHGEKQNFSVSELTGDFDNFITSWNNAKAAGKDDLKPEEIDAMRALWYANHGIFNKITEFDAISKNNRKIELQKAAQPLALAVAKLYPFNGNNLFDKLVRAYQVTDETAQPVLEVKRDIKKAKDDSAAAADKEAQLQQQIKEAAEQNEEARKKYATSAETPVAKAPEIVVENGLQPRGPIILPEGVTVIEEPKENPVPVQEATPDQQAEQLVLQDAVVVETTVNDTAQKATAEKPRRFSSNPRLNKLLEKVVLNTALKVPNQMETLAESRGAAVQSSLVSSEAALPGQKSINDMFADKEFNQEKVDAINARAKLELQQTRPLNRIGTKLRNSRMVQAAAGVALLFASLAGAYKMWNPGKTSGTQKPEKTFAVENAAVAATVTQQSAPENNVAPEPKKDTIFNPFSKPMPSFASNATVQTKPAQPQGTAPAASEKASTQTVSTHPAAPAITQQVSQKEIAVKHDAPAASTPTATVAPLMFDSLSQQELAAGLDDLGSDVETIDSTVVVENTAESLLTPDADGNMPQDPNTTTHPAGEDLDFNSNGSTLNDQELAEMGRLAKEKVQLEFDAFMAAKAAKALASSAITPTTSDIAKPLPVTQTTVVMKPVAPTVAQQKTVSYDEAIVAMNNAKAMASAATARVEAANAEMPVARSENAEIAPVAGDAPSAQLASQKERPSLMQAFKNRLNAEKIIAANAQAEKAQTNKTPTVNEVAAGKNKPTVNDTYAAKAKQEKPALNFLNTTIGGGDDADYLPTKHAVRNDAPAPVAPAVVPAAKTDDLPKDPSRVREALQQIKQETKKPVADTSSVTGAVQQEDWLEARKEKLAKLDQSLKDTAALKEKLFSKKFVNDDEYTQEQVKNVAKYSQQSGQEHLDFVLLPTDKPAEQKEPEVKPKFLAPEKVAVILNVLVYKTDTTLQALPPSQRNTSNPTFNRMYSVRGKLGRVEKVRKREEKHEAKTRENNAMAKIRLIDLQTDFAREAGDTARVLINYSASTAKEFRTNKRNLESTGAMSRTGLNAAAMNATINTIAEREKKIAQSGRQYYQQATQAAYTYYNKPVSMDDMEALYEYGKTEEFQKNAALISKDKTQWQYVAPTSTTTTYKP